jgi:hypothetical protein
MSNWSPAAPAADLLKARPIMIQIAPRASSGFLGQEFNRFLFAPVGTDRFGGQLSVVSALARLDLDAWAEAATLDRLPRDAAARKLSVMLRRFTEIPQIAQDSGAIATRLIALLPGGANASRGTTEPPARRGATRGATILAVLVALGVIIGLQFAAHGWSDHAPAPTSTATTKSPPAP